MPAFFQTFQPSSLTKKFFRSFQRFPLPSVLVVLIYFLLLPQIWGIDTLKDNWLALSLIFFTQSFFYTLGAQTFADAQGWSRNKTSKLIGIGYILLAFSAFGLPFEAAGAAGLLSLAAGALPSLFGDPLGGSPFEGECPPLP